MNKSLKIYLPVLLALIIVVLFLWLFYFKSTQAIKTIPEQTWQVNVIKVKKGEFSPEVTLYGRVESPKSTVLEAAIDADVIKAPVKEGYFVKPGELLVQLDDREAKINLQQRKGEVADLKAQIASELIRYKSDTESVSHQDRLVKLQEKEVQRLQYLVNKKVGSESALDKARQQLREFSLKLTELKLALNNHPHRLAQLKARLLKAEALLDQAKLDLERTKIKALFPARVTKVNVSEGNRVQKGEALIELFATDAVEVRAQIPAPYLAVIKESIVNKQDLLAKAFVDGHPIKLKLERLAGFVAQGQGGVDGLFLILNNGKNLAKGRIIELKLLLPKVANAIPIPAAALYHGDIIYTVKDDRLQAISIKQVGQYTDPQGKQLLLVSSPKLKNNDPIVITHLPNARTGLRVKMTDA